MTKPLVYSHTNLACFETCPKQFYHRYLVKDVPFVETEPMRWGNRVHEALENRCKRGRLAELPAGMEAYEKFAAAIDPHPVKMVEEKLGMSTAGKWTGFFAADVWFRGKVDIAILAGDPPQSALILDWKTGKRREDATELQEHAMLLKAQMPSLTKITGAYVWLQEMRIGEMHTLDPASTLRRTRETVERLETQKARGQWPANPSGLCKAWCDVLTCEHNGRRA